MTTITDKTLVLVDGSSYLYRAYHAMPPLTNSNGQPTGAVYGVINMLKRLCDEHNCEHLAIIFDAPGKTFRNDLYPEYKANRPPMPDDLRSQIEPLHELVEALGMPLIRVPGVEADDVIGTLATSASNAGMKTLISTGDKDMAQLVNDDVTLVNTMTNTMMDADGVEEKFGVRPDQIIDYLTLVGDTSDNIPGVPKVGPKTAVKWLAEYDSLDAIIEHADAVNGKIGENLRASLDQLPLSKDLVTIRLNVELEQSLDDLKLGKPDTAALSEGFARMEFKTWLSELLDQKDGVATDDHETTTAQANYITIDTQALLDEWMARLQSADVFAFDTETTSLDYMQARIVGVSFSVTPGEAAYVPLAHDYAGAPDQLDLDSVLQQLKPLLEDESQAKVGQNLKYDMSVLANHGITLRGVRYDTMLESYVLDSTATRHDMDSLALKYLAHNTIHFEDVAGKGAKQLTFNQVPVETAAPYAAEDADVTLRLHQTLQPRLDELPALVGLYRDIEMPLVPVLSRMERNGVLVDRDLLAQQSTELALRMGEIEIEAFAAADGPFNINSPKQIQEILFEKQGLPVLKKTPKGQPSTAEAVLQELALDYPLPRLILEYRSLSKLKSTYTDKLPQQIDADTGRVHTSYHQAVAATGRLSSSDPNLQNIPIRSKEGKRIREAFIAPEGFKLVAADYSQIELRIMAHLSRDAGLLRAFSEGADIHRATAAEVFGLSLEAVTSDERRSAKAINFGLIYGMSAFGLARQLGITRGEAQDYVDLYFSRYPGVRTFMDETRERAREQGYVETLFGRRLYLPDINSRNGQRRQYAERTAINAPMQGTAADIIKRAMIVVDEWLCGDQVPATMIMQVHDELVLEVEASAVEQVSRGLCERMAAAASLDVPLVVDADVGDTWGQAHG
ncbi:MAG TPA: DNA polymerase I [Chromatiaceae bacterium]|jgi:DNA polymerase-1|nr:DNA polymerase I [Chromatiaceae bacterium]HIB84572.1 DNA polymerase I [Chromatiaceae bacterium]HIN82128.1 DNA polymerase I [Chromatiales bacterium]HIO14386.1 DNA polymerase I [Chromatiales bacterium]HIO53852.1 DNA polymerase I [Chromatiales bacterium]